MMVGQPACLPETVVHAYAFSQTKTLSVCGTRVFTALTLCALTNDLSNTALQTLPSNAAHLGAHQFLWQ